MLSYWILQKNDTKLIAVACSYVLLWPFKVNFSPKNVNFTKSIVQLTFNFKCRLSEIGKILTQTNGSNTKTVPVLYILEENDVFQMCLGVPALI